TGNTVIYRRETIRRVMRTLHAGRGVAMLIDQHIMSRDAIYVDFFQRPAATTSAVAALALRTGAPVVPVFALPIAGGRYKMIYEPRDAPPKADPADAIYESTRRCTDVLEMYVRRHPELWLWMHRRWRDGAAEGEQARGMFPSADAVEEEEGGRPGGRAGPPLHGSGDLIEDPPLGSPQPLPPPHSPPPTHNPPPPT